ncbi:YceD family protein [Hydrogenimonas sp.]
MRILLRKIREERSAFSIEKERLVCSGEFRRSGKHTVVVEGSIEGDISLRCDRCGEAFTRHIVESFDLEIVDRPLKVNESLDVIECPDGIVDFDTICESEIASIESEYHLCPECKGKSDFEMEF